MFTKHTFTILLLLLSIAPFLQAEEFLTSKQIEDILQINEHSQTEVSSVRNVLFCWSKPDHPKHVHSYQRFAESYASSLSKVKKIQTMTVEGFPSQKQWKSADLVVFNLTQNNLSKEQFMAIDAHLNKGGSVIVVHQGLVQRKGYGEWAKRIGMAFSWEAPPTRSKWGRGVLKINIDNKHDIFQGFPETIRLMDELYWNLESGADGRLSILGKTEAPKRTIVPISEVDSQKWPAFWTVEHSSKEGKSPGRVFCSVVGHPDEIAFSSSFQIVMMRAFAWCLDEPSTPFLRTIKGSD